MRGEWGRSEVALLLLTSFLDLLDLLVGGGWVVDLRREKPLRVRLLCYPARQREV